MSTAAMQAFQALESYLSLQNNGLMFNAEKYAIFFPENETPEKFGFISASEQSGVTTPTQRIHKKVVLLFQQVVQKTYSFLDQNGRSYSYTLLSNPPTAIPSSTSSSESTSSPAEQPSSTDGSSPKPSETGESQGISGFFASIWQCVVKAFTALFGCICCRAKEEAKPKGSRDDSGSNPTNSTRQPEDSPGQPEAERSLNSSTPPPADDSTQEGTSTDQTNSAQTTSTNSNGIELMETTPKQSA